MRRETLIVYGDCQAYAVIRVLHCVREVAERFDLRFHSAEEQTQKWKGWKDEIREASLILLQDIPALETYSYNFVEKERLPPSLLFPSMTFPSLWPFSTEFAGTDAIAKGIYVDRGRSGLHYFDALLGLLRAIPDTNLRYSAYLQLHDNGNAAVAKFLKSRNIARISELDCLRLQKIDLRFDLNVGHFIINSFRNQRLFHTGRHPTVILVYFLVVQLMEKLNLSSRLGRPLVDSLSYFQLPIHPKVIKTLSLEWATPDLTYCVLGSQLTFEHYTRRYIDEFG